MHPSSRRPGLTRTGAALAVGIVSIVAACQTELPPSPRGAARPVSDLSLATAPETTITYTIDGIPVTREQLDAGRGRGRMVRTRTTVEQGSMRGSGFAEVRNESGMLVGSIDSLIAVVPPTLDGDGSESGHIRLTVGAVAKIDASAFQGLLIVDGKRMDARSFASINERSIAMIELMSGPLATKTYADAAAGKGLILVTTRK